MQVHDVALNFLEKATRSAVHVQRGDGEREGREGNVSMLYTLQDGGRKVFRNVNSALNLESCYEEIDNECFVEW